MRIQIQFGARSLAKPGEARRIGRFGQVSANPIEGVGDYVRGQHRMKSRRVEAPIAEFIDRHAEELGSGVGKRGSRRFVLADFEPQTAIGRLGSEKPAQCPVLAVRVAEQRPGDREPGEQDKMRRAFLGRAEGLASDAGQIDDGRLLGGPTRLSQRSSGGAAQPDRRSLASRRVIVTQCQKAGNSGSEQRDERGKLCP